jgi:hypothetical protein
MLNSRESFKVGFLQRCADAGLSLDETRQVVKQATELVKTAAISDLLVGPYRTTLDVAGAGAKNLGNVGLAAALLGPGAIGAAAGYGLSRVTDVDDTDVSAIKKRELIDEYYQQIDMLKAKQRGMFRKPHPTHPGPIR